MQGFNKYYPPDYDPSQGSLNKARGKHALGDRARKLDQGILITRFELPFNIWCGTCNNHIGMGVRYNAEKKKIGNYYSTPIYSFRCKCHLCDGWFEIQTDPKNTRYVVVSGARQKDEDWNPEENGGFAVHDTDKEGAVVDPLAALDKTVTAKHQIETVEKPRIESLQSLSEHYNSDPYSLSLKARKRFREEKKIEQAKAKADTQLKDRYGLATELTLVREDDDLIKEAKTEWQKNRAEMESVSKRRKLGVADTPSIASSSTQLNFSKSSAPNTLATLRARILKNTAKQSSSSSSSQSKLKTLRPP
ncbi:DUF572-domain-containing protein [Panaeolus papilionaceus]|nr:DUF572-domain-containing protein [Panaeolus papilionaceus]